MARKGNQPKNGLDRNTSSQKKGLQSGSTMPNRKGKGNVSDTKAINGEELSNDSQPSISVTEAPHKPNHVKDEKKKKNKSGKHTKVEMQGTGTPGAEQQEPCDSASEDRSANMSTAGSSCLEGEKWASANGIPGPKNRKNNGRHSTNGFGPDGLRGSVQLPETLGVRYLKTFALHVSKLSTEWLESHKPLIDTIIAKIFISRDYVQMKIKHAYPVVLRWLTHFTSILLLLSMVWLDCTLRGIDSVLRMGTTSFFTVLWCSIFSVIATIGMLRFFTIGAVVALVGLFVGFTIALLLLAVSGIVFLWLYGSFWTTLLVLLFGGIAFTFSHERLALLITTLYSVYCAWSLVGWFGIFLALNLSFFSSDALIFFLRNNINEQRRSNGTPEQTAGTRSGPGPFTGERGHAPFSDAGSSPATEASTGAPSTSGSDSDLTSEDEVLRLLNSTDHYSALGLSRFQEIDLSILKREYRKKAMLVHPDKNMGNEKAAEAFKKLQNAYEVLLDTFKRKAYDDELRREDLLNYFRRFQNVSPKNKRDRFFGSTFRSTEVHVEDPLGEARRIACQKCSNFHMWFNTKKTKSKARWCQDCKDFHPAKDGDGWVEQMSQPLLFGIFQKVDSPCAYVCADSKIYDATEWYICQGMRCPANTHKPSFHVNTSVTSKQKGPSSGPRGGGGGMPPFNMDETMTEEEFMAWVQNAVQSGIFDNPPDAPSSSSAPKTTTTSTSKRKKKGKKW